MTIITIIIFISLLIISQVQAAHISCRSDPIVFLSDGSRLQFSTLVEVDLNNIIAINYSLHVPAGLTIDRIVYTPGWAKAKEVVVVVADQGANSYHIDAEVLTIDNEVSLIINASLQNVNSRGIVKKTVAGLSNQTVSVYF